MRQVEVSRTLVFDDPRRAPWVLRGPRGRQRGHRETRGSGRGVRPAGAKNTPGIFRARVFGPGTEVKLEFRYKQSRVKQYLKEGRALRIETVINKPSDLGVLARPEHLPELVAQGRQVNGRLLSIERAGQGCAIGSALFERIHQPYIREGQRPELFASGTHAPWP